MSTTSPRRSRTPSVSFKSTVSSGKITAPPPEAFVAAHHLISGDPLSDYEQSEYPQIMVALGILRQEELTLDRKIKAAQIGEVITEINTLIQPPNFRIHGKNISTVTEQSSFSMSSVTEQGSTLGTGQIPSFLEPKTLSTRTASVKSHNSEKTAKTPTPKRPYQTKKEIQEVDEIIDHLLDGDAFESPSEQLIVAVLGRIGQREKIEIEQYHYKKVEKLQKLRPKLRELLRIKESRPIPPPRDKEADLESVKEQLEEMKEEHAKLIQSLEEEKAKARQVLEQALESERKNFISNLPKFEEVIFHPSTALLQLREEEKSKAKGGDFVAARKIHSQADALEEKEKCSLKQTLLKSSEAKIRALEEEQKIKRDGFESHWEAVFHLKQFQYEKAQRRLLNNIEWLQKELNNEKLHRKGVK